MPRRRANIHSFTFRHQSRTLWIWAVHFFCCRNWCFFNVLAHNVNKSWCQKWLGTFKTQHWLATNMRASGKNSMKQLFSACCFIHEIQQQCMHTSTIYMWATSTSSKQMLQFSFIYPFPFTSMIHFIWESIAPHANWNTNGIWELGTKPYGASFKFLLQWPCLFN